MSLPLSPSFSRYLAGAALIAAVVGLAAWVLLAVGERPGRQGFTAGAAAQGAWLADTGGRLDITGVAGQPEAAWQRWDGTGYLQGVAGEVLWLRVTLANTGTEPARGVLQDSEPYMDRVDAWWASSDRPEHWAHQVAGESQSASARPWQAFTPAFPVEVAPGGTQVVYLRVADYYPVLAWWHWWPRQNDYFSAELGERLLKGVGFGILAALVLYNAVLWIRLRSADLGHYVGYAAAMSVFNLSECGGLTPFIGGLGPAWRMQVEVGALAVSAWCLTGFIRHFLETRVRLPRVDRGLRGLGWVWVAVFAGSWSMPWTSFELWFGVGVLGVAGTHTVALVTGVLAWRQGGREARFFLLAFGVLHVGGVVAGGTWGAGRNTQDATLWLLACSALEMILLSFAIADRFAQTQRRLVEETEQRRMIEETYADELALEVRERTRELEAANADKDRMLAVIGHDLRGPLTGLMKSADRPTADFTRETARTGRALLLMIEDLVLWARMRAGTREIAAHPARGLLQPAVALHRALADSGGTALVVDVPENLQVGTDLVLAQTLVRNLLANALKFARTRVVLRAEARADGVRFSVSNDGEPLPAAIAERLAADQNEPVTATGGLGLRLCREICAALGMKLEARTPTEGGAEFSFTLPAAGEEVP